jgi:hypothetical protein
VGDVKQSLIPQMKKCWAAWNQQIEEHGLMMNARLPQKTKTKHTGRCNKDKVPEADWKSAKKRDEKKKQFIKERKKNG